MNHMTRMLKEIIFLEVYMESPTFFFWILVDLVANKVSIIPIYSLLELVKIDLDHNLMAD